MTLCTELRYRSKDGLFGDFLNIDYAKVAEGYGCKSYSIRTMEELAAAFEDAKKVKDRPVLFDIKVLPKTMTDGYGSWWRVGDTEVSERPESLAAYQDHLDHVRDARKYCSSRGGASSPLRGSILPGVPHVVQVILIGR